MKFNNYLYPILVESSGNGLHEQVSSHIDDSAMAVLGALKPLLDGKHSTAEVYAKLAVAGFELRTVAKVLESLDALRMLADAPAAETGALTEEELRRHGRQIELFDRWLGEDSAVSGPQTRGHQAQVRLRAAQVLIVGLGSAGSTLAKTLAHAGVGSIFGIRTPPPSSEVPGSEASDDLPATMAGINPSVKFTEVEEPEDLPPPQDSEAASLLVYCPDQFDHALCMQLNDLALSTPVPFLIYRQTSFHIEIGPLIFPRETACYICSELRRKGARSGLNADELLPRPPGGFSFPTGVDLVAVEVLKFLTRVALPVSRGKIWRLNLRSGLSEVHPVLKLPRCVACGVHRRTPMRKLWDA